MLLRAAALVALDLALAAGCAAEIGDACTQNVDCSPSGDRVCDVAQSGGYCTVEGCDEGTCPEEALCVRFFPAEFLGASCAAAADCGRDEECLSQGLCADLTTERRFCMRRCGVEGACRDGYACRRTGVEGAELAQDVDTFDPERVGRFCAPAE